MITVQPGCLQRLTNGELTYLPVLYIDGALTEIDKAPYLPTRELAIQYADRVGREYTATHKKT